MAAGRVHAHREVRDQPDAHAGIAGPLLRGAQVTGRPAIAETNGIGSPPARGGKRRDRRAVGVAQVGRPAAPVRIVRCPTICLVLQCLEAGMLGQQRPTIGGKLREIGSQPIGDPASLVKAANSSRSIRTRAAVARGQSISSSAPARQTHPCSLARSIACATGSAPSTSSGAAYQRVQEQPAGWRIRPVPRWLRQEQGMHRAQRDGVRAVASSGFGEGGDGSRVTDAAVAGPAQAINLRRHPPPAAGDPRAAFRRNGQHDLPIADQQPVIARLGDRRQVDAVVRSHAGSGRVRNRIPAAGGHGAAGHRPVPLASGGRRSR